MNSQDMLSGLSALGIDIGQIKEHWEESRASLPEDGPFFLHAHDIQACVQWIGLSPMDQTLLIGAAARILNRELLRHLAWHVYRLVYDYPDGSQSHAPQLAKVMGAEESLFYALIALAVVPRIIRRHRHLNVPDVVTRDTCRQVGCFFDNYKKAHDGKLGIFLSQLWWLRNYINGNLYFRLGRFEYWLEPFKGQYKVFRHKLTQHKVALIGPGCCINHEGYIEEMAGKNGGDEWITSLRENQSFIEGYPINPSGYVLPKAVKLPVEQYDCVLEKGMHVLSMHIPPGDSILPKTCQESMLKAEAFFKRYFPSPSPAAFVCGSWMFSPILEQILPSGSNLVSFMRELYLCPVLGKGPDALWFVFLQTPFNPATAPRKTALQRMVLDYLNQGKVWRNGGMFYHYCPV